MIPRLIHQIWVGPHRMPSRERGFVEAVRARHPEFEHKLWTEPPDLPVPLRIVYDTFGRQRDYALQADVLRVWLVHTLGGYYLDVDLEWQGGLDTLPDGFLCGHWGADYTIPNTAFGLAPGPLTQFLVDGITPATWWYGPSWLGDRVKAWLDLPRETDHALLRDRLAAHGIPYVRWSTFEARHFKHHSLYSWSPENRDRFEKGLMP